MLNLVFGAGGACTCTCTLPPVTNLHIELRASRQLKIPSQILHTPYMHIISKPSNPPYQKKMKDKSCFHIFYLDPKMFGILLSSIIYRLQRGQRDSSITLLENAVWLRGIISLGKVWGASLPPINPIFRSFIGCLSNPLIFIAIESYGTVQCWSILRSYFTLGCSCCGCK